MLRAHRLVGTEVQRRAVRSRQSAPDLAAGGELAEPQDADAVVLADLVVDGRIVEGQRQHALLLQVGLVDPGEAAHDDGPTAAEAGLHGGVLTARALAPVLVADGDPRLTRLVVVPGDLGVRLHGVVEHVEALADLTAEGVDGTEEQVARDVLEVAPVLQPRAGHRDVVGGALARRLHQDGQIEEVLAVPRRERLEQLQSIGRGRDHDLDALRSSGGATKLFSPGVNPASGNSSRPVPAGGPARRRPSSGCRTADRSRAFRRAPTQPPSPVT